MIAAIDNGDLPCRGGERRVLRLAASLSDGIPVDRRNALTLRGMADMAGGRYRQAMSAFEQGLEICRPLDGPWPLATSALNLGTALMHAGDLESADALLAEARVGYQELGDDAY